MCPNYNSYALLCITDIPAPPTNFNFEEHPDNTRAITITWIKPVQNGPVDEIEDYVTEQSINGGEFQQV